MLMKLCKICNLKKQINQFNIVKGKNGKEYNLNFCIDCKKIKKRKYRSDNKEKIANINKKYYQRTKSLLDKKKNALNILANKNNKKEYDKIYRLDNKKKYQEYCKIHKSEISVKRHKYYLQTKNKKSEYNKRYALLNKSKIYEKNYKYMKRRLEYDIRFKLRCSVSKTIRSSLKNKKNGESCIKYLSYTIQELKQHLEKQFESWMTWKNWGVYKKTWDDQDSSTWKWQIDHIIPQSCLLYSNMNEDNFKKCWALENLRPLSAKDNLIKSNKFDKAKELIIELEKCRVVASPEL